MAPNPVVNKTVMSVASATATDMTIVVTDVTGKKVATRSIKLVAGSNQVTLDFSNLASGSYQVTGYTAEEGAKSYRFIKN